MLGLRPSSGLCPKFIRPKAIRGAQPPFVVSVGGAKPRRTSGGEAAETRVFVQSPALALGGCCTNEIRALSAANEALGLLKSVDADRVFADAAEVEFAVVFDDIGDLAIAVRRAVLEVFDDAALRVEGDDE